MNDQAARYVRMLKVHVDRVIIAVLYVLLAVLGYLWLNEERVEDLEGGTTVAQLVDLVANNPEYKKIQALGSPQEMSQYPLIEQIRKYNMFDFKSVKEKEAIERDAKAKVDQARSAVQGGRIDEAKRLLNEVLSTFPTHRGARDLLDQLNAAPSSAASPSK